MCKASLAHVYQLARPPLVRIRLNDWPSLLNFRRPQNSKTAAAEQSILLAPLIGKAQPLRILYSYLVSATCYKKDPAISPK